MRKPIPHLGPASLFSFLIACRLLRTNQAIIKVGSKRLLNRMICLWDAQILHAPCLCDILFPNRRGAVSRVRLSSAPFTSREKKTTRCLKKHPINRMLANQSDRVRPLRRGGRI